MNYDLAIIGAGWAGFNAALRAKELGLRTCLIDQGKVGGTCLHRGCIPTKTLIQSAKLYLFSKKANHFGLEIDTPARINFIKIQERKEWVIQKLYSGMQSMLSGIDFFNAKAKFLSSQELSAGEQIINAKHILIATGSRPMELADLKFDGQKIISSDELLNLKEVPKSLLIIGGGVIGCEFASLFSILGTRVSIIEKMPRLLPAEDIEISKKLQNIFKKEGINVSVDTDAKSIDLKGFDLTLLCIGRTPETAGLDLDKAGVRLDKAMVCTDEYLKTNAPNIYAAGDCAGKIMLAHLASYQGRMSIDNIASPQALKGLDSLSVPNCIFTYPQIASIGLNQEQAQAKGLDIKINKFDFLSSGMARILDETDGFIKIISNNKTQEILGASIIGPQATELIGILTLAVSTRLKISHIKDTVFAHPTLSESIGDCLKKNHGA